MNIFLRSRLNPQKQFITHHSCIIGQCSNTVMLCVKTSGTMLPCLRLSTRIEHFRRFFVADGHLMRGISCESIEPHPLIHFSGCRAVCVQHEHRNRHYPTPPGTGVIAEAFCRRALSKCTSPNCVSFRWVVNTIYADINHHHAVFEVNARDYFRRTDCCHQNSPHRGSAPDRRGGWQIVTIAFAWEFFDRAGFATSVSSRQHCFARPPRRAFTFNINLCPLQNFHHACGCTGRMQGSPATRRLTFCGMKAIHIFEG